VEALLLHPSFNHRTHRIHGNKASPCYVMLPCIRRVPWFPALRRQESIRGRRTAVPSGSLHSDGLEERQPTQRDDAPPAPRRRLGLATIVPLDASQPANGSSRTCLPASHVHISSHLQVRIHLQRRLGRTQLEDIESNPQHSDEKYGCSDAPCRPIICATDHPVAARDLPLLKRPTRRLGCIGWLCFHLRWHIDC